MVRNAPPNKNWSRHPPTNTNKNACEFWLLCKAGLSWKRGKSLCIYCCTFLWFRHQLHHLHHHHHHHHHQQQQQQQHDHHHHHHHHHHHQDQARQKRNTSWHDNVTQKKRRKHIFLGKTSLLPKSFITSKRPKTAAISDWLGATTSGCAGKKEPSNSPETHSKRSKASWKTCRDLEEKNCVCSKLKWLPKCPIFGKKIVKHVQVFSGKQPIVWGNYVFRKVMFDIGVAFHPRLFGFELPRGKPDENTTAKMHHFSKGLWDTKESALFKLVFVISTIYV